jgi:hypothetical protein
MSDGIAVEPGEGEVDAASAAVSVGPGGVVAAGAGLLALGASVAVGAGSLDATVRMAPLLVGPAFGAVLLTTPALVVAHQFLRIGTRASDLADVLGRAMVRVGQVGWGFAPVSLLFAVTAPGSWPVLFLGDGLLLGAVGLAHAGRDLVRLDRKSVAWEVAVVGWALLTLVVAVRLVVYALPAHF